MAQKDYYKILELPKTSTEQEIKSAYRKLARKYHPDVNQDNPQAAEHFKEISEAYEVLGDPEKRQKYDSLGSDWERLEKAGFGSSSRGGNYTYDYANPNGGFGDIFDSIFGTSRGAGGPRPNPGTGGTPGGRPGGNSGPSVHTRASDFGFGRGATPRPQRGDDLEQPLEVSLEEAYQGSTRQLQVQSTELCSYCNGTGMRSGQRCTLCGGRGVVPRPKRLEVRIPPGVDDGTKVKVPGEGGPGVSSGARGDLLLRIQVLPHPAFVRKGPDLHTTATISLYTAILGGEIIVASPKGSKFALNVPAETQNGKIFRLTNQGMPVLNVPNSRGDMYVKIEVNLPSNLSEQERQLFQQLKDLR